MPSTWPRRFTHRRNSPRALSPRRPALAVEALEGRALMSATLVQDILPPADSLNQVINETAVNGKLFFTINDYTGPGGSQQTELWSSDGTPAGTVHLRDFQPSTSSVGPFDLTGMNGTLYFAINDTAEAGLWKSDGTAAGTVRVEAFSYLNDLTALNGSLYFSGVGTPSSAGLWKSDGTAAGTVEVQNLLVYLPLTAMNGSLFFSGADPANLYGQELCKDDIPHGGAGLVKDIAPGPASSAPFDLIAVHNTLFFEVANPPDQSGLWASDGTRAGTLRVSQAVPYSAADMADVNGTLYFLNAGPTNPGLWKSDGTPAGTALVTPIGNGDDATVSMTTFQGELYYQRRTDGGPGELWKTDGTAAGTVKVTTLPASASPSGDLTVVNGTLFFTAYDAAGGVELWKSAGTAAGTVMVEDVGHDVISRRLANVNGTLFFTVSDGQGIQIWTYNPAVGPTAAAGGPYTITAGESVTLTGQASTGAGPLVYAWTVNGHPLPGSPGQASLTLSWATLTADGITGPGTYAVILGVTDGQTTSTSEADLIVRSPLLNVTGATAGATEGTAFSGTAATFTDPAGAQPVGTYNAQVDWGDGSAPTSAAIVATAHGFAVTGTHTYAEAGTYTVTASVAKGGGLPNTVTTTLKVADAPIWAGREFLRTTEGKAFTGTVATITDGNPLGKPSDFTATIKWGDGTTSTGTVTQTGPGKFAVQGGHTYAAAGTYTVTVSAKDAGGSTSTAQSTFLVDDAPLTAVPPKTLATVTPAVPSQTVVAGFTDANPLATAGQFVATIDWGDGTTSAGAVSRAAGQPFFVVAGSHRYAKPGSYKVTTTIRDAGGSKLTAMLTLPK